jgi:hypothetical protein
MVELNIMKRSPFHPPKFDLLALQTTLEIAAGGVAAAMLLRWVM